MIPRRRGFYRGPGYVRSVKKARDEKRNADFWQVVGWCGC